MTNVTFRMNKTYFLGLCVLYLSSCAMLENQNNLNKNSVLEKIESIESSYEYLDALLYVDIPSQQMFFIKKGEIVNIYSISSSYYGTGNKVNSLMTPLGKHEIYKKLGENLPENAILKGRVWNGAIADIIKEPLDTDFDHVTSRILWLDCLLYTSPSPRD